MRNQITIKDKDKIIEELEGIIKEDMIIVSSKGKLKFVNKYKISEKVITIDNISNFKVMADDFIQLKNIKENIILNKNNSMSIGKKNIPCLTKDKIYYDFDDMSGVKYTDEEMYKRIKEYKELETAEKDLTDNEFIACELSRNNKSKKLKEHLKKMNLFKPESIRGYHSETPLMIACSNGLEDIIDVLLEFEDNIVNINFKYNDNRTAVMYALNLINRQTNSNKKPNLEILKKMMKYKARWINENQYIPYINLKHPFDNTDLGEFYDNILSKKVLNSKYKIPEDKLKNLKDKFTTNRKELLESIDFYNEEYRKLKQLKRIEELEKNPEYKKQIESFLNQLDKKEKKKEKIRKL